MNHSRGVELDYYATAGAMTDARDYVHRLQDLPDDPAGLAACLQGLVIHIFWAKRYGVELSEARQAEVNLRPVWRKLTRMVELGAEPLSRPRPLERRLVGNCRDISVLMCTALRAQGRPARARCGFGTYFMPDHFEDHWICEMWDEKKARWVMVDAQLDELQREVLAIDFDPLDVPSERFITGGQAWKMCRDGQADPEQFGIFQWHGWDFIRGNVLRDLLALNKFELLPWDFWSALEVPVAESTQEELALIDHAAGWAASADFVQVRGAWDTYPKLQPPEDWAD